MHAQVTLSPLQSSMGPIVQYINGSSELSEVVNGTRKDYSTLSIGVCGIEGGKDAAWITPSAWFRRLCESTEVREWLKEQKEDGNDFHFVVGFHTLFDASTAEGLALTSTHGGNFSVALSELSTLPVHYFMDFGASATFKNNQAVMNR
ncbi:uncharacterized protein N7477_004984 [Penicillium maclennaniae]|uniref:uncharacterized protein n=1 Tax=Penicillium maclennaniae TaxID=1343394 RepID=UPI002541CE96|nr:uncharacterized protein N7477_004984 [Penicillium maclennaniae]KAJ5675050.1 hypothetical protein N7477_004984 [Penicillium maclennaniae]